MAELDALVSESLRGRWSQVRRAVLDTVGCPSLSQWMGRREGQRLEQLLGELAVGERDDAYCAIVLLFQLARRTSWDPGVFGGSEDAERLGQLLGNWLATWAEPAAADPLLREPALAAAVAYGGIMHAAFEGNFFSSSPSSLERARRFLATLVGEPGRNLTDFGAALGSRYPNALSGALAGGRSGAVLSGFAEEMRLWFPDLNGDCDG